MRPRTIHIILPFLNSTGGVQVAAEYARHLHERGHRVAIFAPTLPYRFADRLYTPAGLRRWVGDLRLNITRGTRVRWRETIGTVPLNLVPWIGTRYLPPADAVIATAWPTAYALAGLAPRCGTPLYLIQHYETWSGTAAAIEGSFRLPLHRIVIASWLRVLLEERFGVPVLATITNGVDTELFTPAAAPNQRPHRPRILMQYNPLPWKGLADGFAAWSIVKTAYPGAQLVLFGIERGPEVPTDAEFHRDPSRAVIADLYRSSTVFVSTSWAEGCQLPPMEAMACGCAVVATDVGGIPDYAVAGTTALVVAPHDPAGTAAAILSLLRDAGMRAHVATAGYRHIQQFTWERATARLETALDVARGTPPVACSRSRAW